MKAHAIHWESTVSGSTGTGTKRFEKEEAGRLAKQLNEKGPDINHEAVIPAPTLAELASIEPGSPLNVWPMSVALLRFGHLTRKANISMLAKFKGI